MGNGTFAIIPRKCEYENDAGGLKTYFAIDFGIIFGNFRAIVKKIGAVWDFCGFLFLYRRQPPIFPIGMALFFHVELPIIRHWRPLVSVQVAMTPTMGATLHGIAKQ